MAIEDDKLYGLTGEQVKDLIEKVEDSRGVRVLTTADYDYPEDNPNSVAAWKLDPGWYRAPVGVQVDSSTINVLSPADFDTSFGVSIDTSTTTSASQLTTCLFSASNGTALRLYRVRRANGSYISNTIFEIANNLTTNGIGWILDARQGKVLNEKIGGDLANLTTSDKTSLINAINEVAAGGGGGGVEVVQTTGDSETAAMSQKATTGMVYNSETSGIQVGENASAGTLYDLAIGRKASSVCAGGVAIGNGAVNKKAAASGGTMSCSVAIGLDASTTKSNDIAIGESAAASGGDSIAISRGAKSSGAYSIAIGRGSEATAQSAIAIGAYSQATRQGEFNIGTSIDNGYNNSSYRLLTGLYDPQGDHDAATKGYVDAHAGGGSGSGITHLTAADMNYPQNNPNSIASWLLAPGLYILDDDTSLRTTSTDSAGDGRSLFAVFNYGGTYVTTLIEVQDGFRAFTVSNPSGFNVDGNGKSGLVITGGKVQDTLSSTSTTRPLSGNQGRILNEKITALEARVAELESKLSS